eukprot:5094459-Prymnesium_polylepis.1
MEGASAVSEARGASTARTRNSRTTANKHSMQGEEAERVGLGHAQLEKNKKPSQPHRSLAAQGGGPRSARKQKIKPSSLHSSLATCGQAGEGEGEG